MSAVGTSSNWRVQQVLEDNGMEIPELGEVPRGKNRNGIQLQGFFREKFKHLFYIFEK